MIELAKLVALHDEALRAHNRLVAEFEGLYGINLMRRPATGRLMDRWCAMCERDPAIAAFEAAVAALSDDECRAVLDACHAPAGSPVGEAIGMREYRWGLAH